MRQKIETTSEVLHHLKTRGEVFIKTSGSLVMRSKCYNQNEITILKTYRFEGESDLAGLTMTHLLKANDDTIGYCIDGYCLYSSTTNGLYGDLISQAKVTTSYLLRSLHSRKHQSNLDSKQNDNH